MAQYQIIRNRSTGLYVTDTVKGGNGHPVLFWGEREFALMFFLTVDVNGSTEAQRLAAYFSYCSEDYMVETF